VLLLFRIKHLIVDGAMSPTLIKRVGIRVRIRLMIRGRLVLGLELP